MIFIATFAVMLTMGPNGLIDTLERIVAKLPTMEACAEFVEAMSSIPPVMDGYVLQVVNPCQSECTSRDGGPKTGLCEP